MRYILYYLSSVSRTHGRRRSWPYRLGGWLGALATYDLFPEFSAKVRRLLYNALGVLVLAALAALLCGLVLHPQGFVLMALIVMVILLGITWPWLSLRGLSGVITFGRLRTSEGERVEVGLTLHHRLPWSAWGLAVRGGFDGRPTPTAGASPVATIASVPRWCTVRCRWSFTPACRGVYPSAAPCLTTGFPFGLWESKRVLAVENPLLVWPRTFPVGPVPLDSGDQQVEGNVSRHKVGNMGDVLGVRPYRRGDSPRRIHWGQSARHDRLIICELQSNARPVIQLILDTDPRVHAGSSPAGSREWVIRIVASLAKGWLEAGAQLGAVWNGQSIPAASGQGQLQRLLDSLAKLPDGPGTALSTTLASSACRGFTSGLQVVVTTAASLTQLERSNFAAERRRWVVLQEEAFTGTAGPSVPRSQLPVCPWLWIHDPEHIPMMLRGGWKEAQHGC